MQSNLVDWIVIDNKKSKLDFGFEFGLSIQFYHFNPNPKSSQYFAGYRNFKKMLGCLWAFNIYYSWKFFKIFWIVIGFGLDCQSILKSGFGMTITYMWWIWIRLIIQKNWIEQQPDKRDQSTNFHFYDN